MGQTKKIFEKNVSTVFAFAKLERYNLVELDLTIKRIQQNNLVGNFVKPNTCLRLPFQKKIQYCINAYTF